MGENCLTSSGIVLCTILATCYTNKIMNRVVHFEIQADNPVRAMKFYKSVFGWEFPVWMKEPLYYGVMTGSASSPQAAEKEPGINGGLLARQGGKHVENAAVNAYVCTVQVDSYDKTHDKILAAGGTVALPKHAITGIAWQGYYKDTEGNIFGIHQPDKKAK